MSAEIEALSARVLASYPGAKTEIDGETLYVEIGEHQYDITFEGGVYHFRREASGYESEMTAVFSLQGDVMESIAPPSPRR